MRAPKAPSLDARRAPQFAAELFERARGWIPAWGLADGERDFGRALLEVAARFSSEVAERLDDAGDKMRRGFLDWLAVRGEAARPARVPVVFKLADAAREPVLAGAPVRMQAAVKNADGTGASVVFETESDVRLLPGRLQTIVGVDAERDEYYLPPPGLSDLEPLAPLPTQWQLKSFAARGAKKLQLDPETGLAKDMVLESGDLQYRITAVEGEIVTVEPPLTAALLEGTVLRKVTAFAPFDGKTRGRQEHALYIGHMELLDLTAPATIAISGAPQLRAGVTWQYWGKVDGQEGEDWQPLTVAGDKEQLADTVVLKKEKKGAVEPHEVNGKKSRWIRAHSFSLPAGESPLRLSDLRIRINAVDCDTDIPCADDKGEPPAAEGLANTTPLVLESAFLPLGREPRQFDAFYLGSAEAFSKPGAKVQLCFQMADPSFESLAVQHSGPFADRVLAGVARDGHLHLFRFDPATGRLSRYQDVGPQQPPSPGPSGAAVAGPAIMLDQPPTYRAAMWTYGSFIFVGFDVAVAAAGSVWVWQHFPIAPALSGWNNFGIVGPVVDSTMPIAGLVHLASGQNGQLFALRERKLFVRDLNATSPTWQPVDTQDGGGVTIELESIVAVGVESGGSFGAGTLAEGLVGVDKNERLYAVALAGTPLAGTCTKLLDGVAIARAPAAFRRGDDRLVAVAVDNTDQKLLGFLSTVGTRTLDHTDEVALDASSPLGHSIDVHFIGGRPIFALALQIDLQTTAIARWTPFASASHAALFTTTIPAPVGSAGGSPTLVPTHVIVPAASSQVLVAPFDPSALLTIHTTLESALIASTLADQLTPAADQAAIPDGSPGLRYQVLSAPGGIPRGSETLYEFAVDSIDKPVFVYRAAPPTLVGTIVDPAHLDQLQLDPADSALAGRVLLVTTDLSTKPYRIAHVLDPVQRIVELHMALDVADPTTSPLYQIEVSGARLVPLLNLDPNTTGNWPASLLARTYLIFPGAEPERQQGTAFQVDANGHPMLVALSSHWTATGTPPHAGQTIEFQVDAVVGDWTAQLGDTSSNPALSWEYGNGTGWWKLDRIHDETLNLKRTGAVRFEVPADLRPTDWAGRKNHWIRARLIGGDYGKETVTVKSVQNGNTTTQTIDRSSDGISPPSVLGLHISYRLCSGALPSAVWTEDSGSFSDQTDANGTSGAIVEAFVPLAVSLGRLSSPAAPSSANKEERPASCDCASSAVVVAGAASAAAPTSLAAPATGRFLFVGLKASPSGAPVNVLLLVEEHDHEGLAPMKIAALVANHFDPIVADDSTRALGESGLLKLTFAREPTPRELFGMDGLTWLRLTPDSRGSANDWMPTLRGAYLNAVWASAQETLTRELLGSSAGEPDLVVRLARPPVLRGTLELRVREPLGDEERAALCAGDPSRVLSDVEGLPGHWVLWKPVIDPGDEKPSERVYALDETSGEIRFGDGRHGKIPPIGRDSIVAFTYKRTEGGEAGTQKDDDVPGNAVVARTALDLVSPVESVEAVFAADQAAGGAPPETDERVLRFGTARLRHRNRALTAADFEDLALQSSPDVVQARCFVGRSGVKLVVVMRGKDPQPNAAEARELRRLLLSAAPASLAAPGALRVVGPRVRRLRIVLPLRLVSLDDAGAVSGEVGKRVVALFDTAVGGIDRCGWALGRAPSREEVARALLDVPRLEGLGDVDLLEVLADGAVRPWAGSPKRDELVMLDEDAVRLEYELVDVVEVVA